MFRFSFNQIPEKKESEEQFPLIAALNFAHITPDKEISQKPVICSTCGSVLSNPKDLEQQNDGSYQFSCRFCLHKNNLSKTEGDAYLGISENVTTVQDPSGTSASDLAFLLDQIRDEKESAMKGMEVGKSGKGFPIQVAVIDISGSMGGGKIEAVKHALVQNIHELTADYPTTKFALIPFSTNLDVYINPSQATTLKDGPSFFKEEALAKEAAKLIEKHSLDPIEKIYEKWTGIVKNLHTLDMTALGPALYVGTQIIVNSEKGKEKKQGGKVLLLTDGLANVGMGAVEGSQSGDNDKSMVFYNRLAQQCLDYNIIVDIVAVRDAGGGNSVALNIIGKITDYTGGKMVFITSDQIEAAFGDLHRTNFVAKNVVLRVFAPPFLALDEIQGADVLQSIPRKSGEAIRLGAFYADREIYLKFKQGKDAPTPGTKIPIQIQLDYLDAQDAHRVRIVEQEVEITKDPDDFKKKYNAQVATAYELSKASKMKAEGKYESAKKYAMGSKSRNMLLQQGFGQTNDALNELVDDEMDEWATEEETVKQQNIADTGSYYASMGQTRLRASFDSKMDRMKKKKK